MPFMHPTLFAAGAGAVSVPILIHLLNRRRFKIVEWAAMRFLQESARKNRRRVRIEELILLALRCLAVFLLAVAVARFVGCAAPGPMDLGGRVQTTHVFVLDDSVSMGQKIADTTAFQKAATDLGETVQAMPPGDRLAVLLTSRPERARAVFDLKDSLSDPEALADRLRTLRVSDTRSRLDEALLTAAEMFAEVSTSKSLVILSDFREADFVGSEFIEQVRQQLSALRADGVEIRLLNYGAEPGANLTVQEVKVLNKLVVASVPIRAQLAVRNNGPARAENVAVSFSLRTAKGVEVKLPARTIRSIDPKQTAIVQMLCELPEAGAAAISGALPADTVAGDNTATLALEVRQARRVLVVDGEPDPSDPPRGESHFLIAAIDPSGDQRYGSQAEVVPVDQLAEVDFDRYDAVVLANVAEFPLSPAADGKVAHAQLEALEKYVRNGGGVLIFLGDRAQRSFYNGRFYQGGTGLCPLRLGPPVEKDPRGLQFVRLLKDSISGHPVMWAFQGERSQFTRFVRFFGYVPARELAPPTASAGLGPVRVLARFDNTEGEAVQSPAVVSRDYGRGVVMMVCSSADTEWTDWPKDLTFVPFVNDVLDYISRSGGGGRTGRVGQRIDYAISPDEAAAKALLRTPAFPAEDVVMLEGRWVGARRQLSYEDTRHAGAYELQLTLPDETRAVLFARNVDPREGVLRRAGDEQTLQGWLGVEFTYVDRLKPAESASAEVTDRREYWKLALALMLVVLAVEVFLAQRFGHYR